MKIIGRTGKVAGHDLVVTDLVNIGAAPENDYQVLVPGISRHHARIVKEGDAYWLEDAGSTNGTFLNGQRVARERLRHLDVITLGRDVDLITVASERAEAAPAPQTRAVEDAWLEPVDQRDAPRVELPLGEITMGRLAPSNVLLDSPVVSQLHAKIRRTADHVIVQDLSSANGTFVNGKTIEEPTALADGDLLSLAGSRQFRVHVVGNARRAKPQEVAATPSAVFDPAWQTRLMWSADELSQFEAERRRILESLGKGSAAAAPAPAVAAKPAAAAPAPAAKPATPPAAAKAAAPPAEKPVAPAAPAAVAPPAAAPVVAKPPVAPPVVVPPVPAAAPPVAPAPAVAPPAVPAAAKPAAPSAPAAAPPVVAPPAPVTPIENAPPVASAPKAPAPPVAAAPPVPVVAPVPPAPVAAKPPTPAVVEKAATPAPPPRPVAPPQAAQPPAAPVKTPPAKPVPPDEAVTIAPFNPHAAATIIAMRGLRGMKIAGEKGTFTLTPGRHVIGRSESAAVTILDPQVSRAHAVVTLAADARVEDTGSSNGTFVNGERVPADGAVLKTGDRLAFGSVEFTVELIS